MADEKSIDRKTFLKEAPLVFLRAFAEGAREERTPKREYSPPSLRPPGAAEGDLFLELCCGIGACAESCPAEAIQMRRLEENPDQFAPVIVPAESPCVLCEELACMKVCPSGALTLIPREEIRIGRARVHPEECLAWGGIDPGCNYCADRCPIGSDAIFMEKSERGKGPVVKEGCVGCGICEFYCPAGPAAIHVVSHFGVQ